MRRPVLMVVLAVAFIAYAVEPVYATKMMIAATSLPDWRYTPPGTTVYLQIYVSAAFTENVNLVTIQPSAPGSGKWYKQYPCTVTNVLSSGETIPTLNLPAVHLDSTTDAIDYRGARYSAVFVDSRGTKISNYAGFESFAVPPAFATGPTGTWSDIRTFNVGPVQPQYDLTYYSREETNRLIAEATVSSGGLATLNGVNAPMQSFANEQNLSIVSAGTTHTLAWLSTLSVGRGGTGSSTSAGARTNLGAAAAGANSDITSLTGLTTPLSPLQGGTGFGASNPYTPGSLLYPSTSTTLAQLLPGTAGWVLTTQGPGLPPQWSAAAGTIGGSGTADRIAFWSSGTTLANSANLAWSSATSRLALGGAAATETVNLPNAGYLGGAQTGGAIRKLIGLDASNYVSIAGTGDRTVVGGQVTQNLSAIADFSPADAAIFTPYQVTPIASGTALRGAYTTNAPGNNFHFASFVTTTGTRPTVAVFAEGVAGDANGTVAWGINPVAYTIATGTNASGVIAIEGNFGVLGNSTNAAAFGIVLAANGSAAFGTTAGANRSYMQMQVTTGADITAAPAEGIVFNSAGGVNAIQPAGTLIAVNAPTTAMFGIDFEDLDAASAAIGLANDNFVTANNAAKTSRLNVVGVAASDFLEIGHNTYSATGQQGIVLYPGSGETMRFARGATSSEAGNIGLAQTAPVYQLHQTAISKRVVTGTHAVTNGSAGVVGTATAYLTELAPGSTFQPATDSLLYTVALVASNTSLTLTTNYTGTTNAATTAKTDWNALLVEAASGDNWLAFDDRHTLNIFGNSTYSDDRGILSLRARANPSKKLLVGIDDASSAAYISSLQSGVGWKPLILQGGAASFDTGGVVIGTSTPSVSGAMLKVEGGGAKTANHVGSEFNDQATSVSSFQKIAAQYLSAGSWVGENISIYARPHGGLDTSGNRTNYPLLAVGGKSYFGPTTVEVSLPVTPAAPGAALHVYGYPADSLTLGGDTLQTTGPGTYNGTGTTWATIGAADRLRVGDAVMFGSDSQVYLVSAVNSNTQFTTTDAYAGTPASGVEAWRDPPLLKLSNGYGVERFRVESSGFAKLTGSFVQEYGDDVASVAGAISLGAGNVFNITGTAAITSIATDATEAGKVVVLVFTSTASLADGSNLKLSANFTGTADATVMLVSDGANWFELSRSTN